MRSALGALLLSLAALAAAAGELRAPERVRRLATAPLAPSAQIQGWTRVARFSSPTLAHVGGMDGVIRSLDVRTGKVVSQVAAHAGVIRALDASPDGRYLYSADDAGELLRLDLAGAEPTAAAFVRPEGKSENPSVRAFRLSPDARLLAAAGHDGGLHLWDAETTAHVRTVPLGKTIYDVAFSNDGEHVFAGGRDGVVRRVSVRDGSVLEMPGHSRSVRALAVRPGDGLVASAAEDGTVRAWDPATGLEVARHDVDAQWVRSLAFSPGAGKLYTGNIDGRVSELDVAPDGRLGPARTLFAHDDVVFHAVPSPDGRWLLTAARDLRIGLLAADGMLSQLRASGGPVHALAVLPDQTIAGTSHDGQQLWWSKPQLGAARLPAHDGPARALAAAPDGRTATGGDDGRVLVRRPGEVRAVEMSGRAGRLRSLDFAPDGRLLAGGGDGRVLRFWDSRSGRLVRELRLPDEIEVIHAVAFAPDGRRVAVAGRNGVVYEIDLSRPDVVAAWPKAHAAYIRSLAWTRDGRRLASGGRDGAIWVWDAEAGRPLVELKGHSDDVNSLEFDDRGVLLSASDDKTVRVWDGPRSVVVARGDRPFSAARYRAGGAEIVAVDDRQALATFRGQR